jgi:8-oxo-dGTP diphosphatase
MKNTEGIHILSRALIIFDNELLLTTDVARNVSFLPGGHIHHGEQATDALMRELREELGIDLEVGKLLGVIESGWDYNGGLYHEYNLIFDVPISTEKKDEVKSCEAELQVEWVPIDKLDSLNIFPKILVEKINDWTHSSGELRFDTEWTDE